jgi:hypothetical protein
MTFRQEDLSDGGHVFGHVEGKRVTDVAVTP